eukprot:6399815-Pyramimonas_sp.AAC.2
MADQSDAKEDSARTALSAGGDPLCAEWSRRSRQFAVSPVSVRPGGRRCGAQCSGWVWILWGPCGVLSAPLPLSAQVDP